MTSNFCFIYIYVSISASDAVLHVLYLFHVHFYSLHFTFASVTACIPRRRRSGLNSAVHSSVRLLPHEGHETVKFGVRRSKVRRSRGHRSGGHRSGCHRSGGQRSGGHMSGGQRSGGQRSGSREVEG